MECLTEWEIYLQNNIQTRWDFGILDTYYTIIQFW
jgi:hypothetical protein